MKKIALLLLFSLATYANTIGEDNNALALSLFSKMKQTEENVAFSPYSIFTNLSLLYGGAEGETAQEIKNLLHIDGDDKSFFQSLQSHMEGLSGNEHGYQLHQANGIFAHQGTHILKSFETLANTIFSAQIEPVDFSIPETSLQRINSWISDKTNGKIDRLVTENDIDESTRLILANAVYFEGQWTRPFSAEHTKKALFRPEGDAPIAVEMLRQTNSFPYFENQAVQCLALPFIRADHSQPFLECILLLPKEGPIAALESHLTNETLDSWIFSTKQTYVDVQVPKFCLSEKMNLSALLKSLGMKEAFTYQANFSKIDGLRDLFLDRVLHETYFSFHENGVTAAAATTSHMGVTSAPQIPEDKAIFIADRPFLFLIVDYHSRAILFMGRVSNPRESDCDDD